MKAFRYISYALIILAAIGLLCWYIFIEKRFDSSDIIKCALILSGAILGIFKAGKRRTPKVKVFFQKAYGEFIDGAFSDSPTQERKLYAAIYDYYRQKPSSSYAKLLKLRKECQRTNDIYAVTVFLGLCCDDMGIYEDAISHYQAALAIRHNSTVFSNMGLCFQHIGKFEEAEDAYRNAL